MRMWTIQFVFAKSPICSVRIRVNVAAGTKTFQIQIQLKLKGQRRRRWRRRQQQRQQEFYAFDTFSDTIFWNWNCCDSHLLSCANCTVHSVYRPVQGLLVSRDSVEDKIDGVTSCCRSQFDVGEGSSSKWRLRRRIHSISTLTAFISIAMHERHARAHFNILSLLLLQYNAMPQSHHQALLKSFPFFLFCFPTDYDKIIANRKLLVHSTYAPPDGERNGARNDSRIETLTRIKGKLYLTSVNSPWQPSFVSS